MRFKNLRSRLKIENSEVKSLEIEKFEIESQRQLEIKKTWNPKA